MTAPAAPEQDGQNQPIFSNVFWTELFLVTVVVGLVLLAAPDLLAWARSMAPVHTHATAANGCHPPTEQEVLFIGVAQRKDGQLVITGCTHAGGKGAYVRRGAP